RVLNAATYEVFRRVREKRIPCGFKDLGAGGIACATSELAAAGGCGATIELERAHRVERELSPEVLLCAETQERYCWVVPETFADELCAVYEREFSLSHVHPGAEARVIGRARRAPPAPAAAGTAGPAGPAAPASDARRYTVTWHGEVLVDCDV